VTDRHRPGDPCSWSPDRLIHRQTYTDLIRAYLADYGSQREFARVLGLSEPYLSYLLEPVRVPDMRKAEHWSVLLAKTGYEIAEAFKYAKTPSQARAERIARLLTSDAERRDVFLEHVRLARTASSREPLTATLPTGQAQAALRVIGDIHQAALHSPAGADTVSSYASVWELAAPLPAAIHPRHDRADYAQALMYLHDVAQALNRPDLGIGFARRAIAALPLPDRPGCEPPQETRLRVNAFLAEVVTLNTLGLHRQALGSIDHAETLPGFAVEPETWLRSFLEQRLTALAWLPRSSRYAIDALADRALSLVPADQILRAGVIRRQLDAYLTRLTPRSARAADRLAIELRLAIAPDATTSPMRRAQILRTLARLHRQSGDHATTGQLIGDCLAITTEANLLHQRSALIREMITPAEALSTRTLALLTRRLQYGHPRPPVASLTGHGLHVVSSGEAARSGGRGGSVAAALGRSR
jgi:transcriptional regulator with XRE-family HTH domain